jgi:hypothetical protein
MVIVLFCLVSTYSASIFMALPHYNQQVSKSMIDLYHLDESSQIVSLFPPILFPAKEPGDFSPLTWDYTKAIRVGSDFYFLTRNDLSGIIALNQIPTSDLTQRHNVTVGESLPISGEPCEIRFTSEVFGLAYDQKTQSILALGINFFSRRLVLASVSLLGGTCEMIMNVSSELTGTSTPLSPFLFDSINRQGYFWLQDSTKSWFFKFDIATQYAYLLLLFCTPFVPCFLSFLIAFILLKSNYLLLLTIRKVTDVTASVLTDGVTWTVRAMVVHPTTSAIFGLKTSVGYAMPRKQLTLAQLQSDATWKDLQTWEIGIDALNDCRMSFFLRFFFSQAFFLSYF